MSRGAASINRRRGPQPRAHRQVALGDAAPGDASRSAGHGTRQRRRSHADPAATPPPPISSIGSVRPISREHRLAAVLGEYCFCGSSQRGGVLTLVSCGGVVCAGDGGGAMPAATSASTARRRRTRFGAPPPRQPAAPCLPACAPGVRGCSPAVSRPLPVRFVTINARAGVTNRIFILDRHQFQRAPRVGMSEISRQDSISLDPIPPRAARLVVRRPARNPRCREVAMA